MIAYQQRLAGQTQLAPAHRDAMFGQRCRITVPRVGRNHPGGLARLRYGVTALPDAARQHNLDDGTLQPRCQLTHFLQQQRLSRNR
ncbi:hypothetical protein [Paludibacterium denitrificans]|uniref:hypothetical protein n=1 Tax=Paludibacterium denitrificans TaxID=2675226 RepID=UPI001E3FB0F5|nr:hypothetical protein [Paludibacterium denitrificans]